MMGGGDHRRGVAVSDLRSGGPPPAQPNHPTVVLLQTHGVGVTGKSDDQRVQKLESVNRELRVALDECREQLERLEKMLERTERQKAH